MSAWPWLVIGCLAGWLLRGALEAWTERRRRKDDAMLREALGELRTATVTAIAGGRVQRWFDLVARGPDGRVYPVGKREDVN